MFDAGIALVASFDDSRRRSDRQATNAGINLI
jgi:hypothetical protein